MDDVLSKISKCNIGFGIERSEDDTLIAGKGIYGDDFGQPPGTLHAATTTSNFFSSLARTLKCIDQTRLIDHHLHI